MTAAEAKLAAELASRARANPRFARKPATYELPDVVDALTVSQLKDAPEDKNFDQEFVDAVADGKYQQFYDYNAVLHGMPSGQFISNDELLAEWARYQAAKPKLSKKAPWLDKRTNRRIALKSLFETSKVPSEFKMQILRKTGFV